MADGTRWSVERDLAAGTVRIFDRDRGEERTREFLRSSGRDVFGERITGLTEALFRSTAYVAQNVLDRDQLDSSLTVELARIADSGGGEASVLRALKGLEAARLRMPEAATGPTVSVETELTRAERIALEREAERDRHRRALDEVGDAVERRRLAMEEVLRLRRKVALLEAAVDETDRRLLEKHLLGLEGEASVQRALQEEADRLEAETKGFSPDLLARVDRLRAERGQRPELLEHAQRAIDAERRAAAEDESGLLRKFGAAAALTQEERERLARALLAVIESESEAVAAEEKLTAHWEELAREGLADDLRRLEQLPPEEREFLQSAEESRQALELAGVRCDRQRADVSHLVTIVQAERKIRVGGGRRLVAAAGVAALLTILAVALGHRVPAPWIAGGAAFAVALAGAGTTLWVQGRSHRLEEERQGRADEARCQAEGGRVRRELSELRLRLDRVARRAGFASPLALVKAHRRARAAEEKRKILIERGARRDAALARRQMLEKEIDAFRRVVACAAGLPSAADARKTLALLEDVEKGLRASELRRETLLHEEARLFAEREAMEGLERALHDALAEAGFPSRLPLPEAFLVVEAARRRLARRREILEVELPARGAASAPGEVATIRTRLASLVEAVAGRLAEAGGGEADLAFAATPETARAAVSEAREALRRADGEREAAEREMGQRARDSREFSRETEEALDQARAVLERARFFQASLDLAREVLTAAAARAYGDFRQGLFDASQQILAAWDLPYEVLEFGDDLSVTARTRDGRHLTPAELAGGLSTGAREQLHLTARLAALTYLGTGARGVPLLLDDPLVGADDQRFRSVMRFLVEKVLPERQVLVVSCHRWRHERLLELLEPELRLRLQPVFLRPQRTGGAPAGAPIDGPGPSA